MRLDVRHAKAGAEGLVLGTVELQQIDAHPIEYLMHFLCRMIEEDPDDADLVSYRVSKP